MSKGKVETSLRFFSAQQSGQKVRKLPKLRSYQVHPTSESVVKKSQRVQTLRAESTQSSQAVESLELCHVDTGERLRGTSGHLTREQQAPAWAWLRDARRASRSVHRQTEHVYGGHDVTEAILHDTHGTPQVNLVSLLKFQREITPANT